MFVLKTNGVITHFTIATRGSQVTHPTWLTAMKGEVDQPLLVL